MAQAKIYDMNGKETGTQTLSDDVFGIEPNAVVMHRVVVAQLANRRQGTQSTLTRTEVRGGGKKPWRQKGTGHARQGSTRSPQWRHGGVALGPKPRCYRVTLNRKIRQLAIKSALSSKVLDGDLLVLDNPVMTEYKTKTIVKLLNELGVTGKALIILDEGADRETAVKVIKSAANIKGVKTAGSNEINTYDILNYGKLIIAKDAVAKIEGVYANV